MTNKSYQVRDKHIAEMEQRMEQLQQQVKEQQEKLDIYDRAVMDKDIYIHELKLQQQQERSAAKDKIEEKNQTIYELMKEKQEEITPETIDIKIVGEGPINTLLVKKLNEGELLMDKNNLLAIWEDVAFFDTKTLIIRIHPTTGKKLSAQDTIQILRYLDGNHYYEFLLDEIRKVHKNLLEVREKAETLAGLPAGGIDSMTLIEKANHLGWILLNQYNKLF